MAKKNASVIVNAIGVLMSFVTALMTAVKRQGGTDEDIYRLVTPEGQELINRIAELIVQVGKPIAKEARKYLRLISGENILKLDACDGSKTIADASDVYKAGIDPDFKRWGVSSTDHATPAIELEVHELVEDGKFVDTYGSLAPKRTLDQMCFTEHQVIETCQKHQKWLRTGGYATFFLLKKNEQYFVASVYLYSDDQLDVYVSRLEYDYVWLAECRRRFVFPKLQDA